jgi:quercetin dioxygenase-like cupin family protein
MPTTATQEVRVLTATLAPGQRSVFHTHRSPVTTYILEGELTLETKGNDTAVYKTGDVFFEVPDVPTTAYNASASDTTKVLIFYVSDPGTPFMEPISQ